jgi:phospholipid/cholesterol/gamma-HCH transport system substrate-binding protein
VIPGVLLALAGLMGFGVWSLLAAGGPAAAAGGRTFTAVFGDVAGLASGSEVRVAGVPVGRVEGVDVDVDGRAVVRFDVQDGITLTSATHAAVKYKNLTGDRYVSLSQPASSPPGSPLPAGGRIPMERTTSALDLDQLFGGFQPLLQGLQPEQINRLSTELVQVLQGEGGTMLALLQDLATFTSSIADRDEVIGHVVDNLSTALDSLDAGDTTLGPAIDRTQSLVSSLSADRRQVVDGVVAVNQVARQVADLLAALRPQLTATAVQVDRLGQVLMKPATYQAVDSTLATLPSVYLMTAAAGSYGSFYNLYLCGLGIRYTDLVGATKTTPVVILDKARCT